MLNVLIALAIAALFGSWVGVYANWIAGLVLGLVPGAVAWVFLLRRTANKLTARMGEVEKHLQASRFDPAIKALEDAKALKLWQFGLIRALDGQIGMLMYVKGQDMEGARARLERAPRRNPAAQAMLAALHARQKRWDDATAVFERALKKNKKSSLLWASYAWCQWKRGQAKDAIEVLARGSQILKSDENLKKNLQNLQNGKKMKMNGWGNEWWSLRLEAPPQQLASPAQMHPAMARAASKARKQRR